MNSGSRTQRRPLRASRDSRADRRGGANLPQLM